MEIPVDSICKIILSENDKTEKREFEIRIIESSNSVFKAKPINSSYNRAYNGEISGGKSSILLLKEEERNLEYVAYYIGLEMPTGLIRFKGNWINTNSEKGDFEFVIMK
jgi:hypothetical protein